MIGWLIGIAPYLAVAVIVGLFLGKGIRAGTDSEREVSGE